MFLVVFWEAPTCSHVAKKAQGLKDKVPKQKFVLLIESWIFTFFNFFCLLMVPYDVIFYGKALFECEAIDFSQEILQNPEFWSFESRTLSIRKISSSFMLTNLRVAYVCSSHVCST
jgi:hypothetical protein